MGILTSLIVLSILVFFHELGHFLAARFFGVRVEVFSIGFGQKVYKKVVGGTEYAISAIPLGGYVKMKGQDDANPNLKNYDADSYLSKSPFQRLVILSAGAIFNFILAFILYFFVALMGENHLAPVIGEIQKESPAAIGGIESGDKILEINNIQIKNWEELSLQIKESDGALSLLLERDKKLKRVVVRPKVSESKNLFGETIQKRMIGISPKGEIVVVSYAFFDALGRGFDKTIESATLIITGLQKLIEGVVPTSEIGGVISIVQVTTSASESGIVALMMLTALISVNLGVLNLLPIPALDGGHIIFVLYEMIFKRAPNEEIMYRLTLVGWVLLIGLMFLGVYNDLNRIFSEPPLP